MRLQLATFLLMAGTIAACSSNPPPPPPPPMAMNEPAPAMQAPTPPPPAPSMSGVYRGTAELTDGGRRCRRMGAVTARVRNNAITVAGARGRIGSDGAVSGRGLSGNVSGNAADLTLARGRCHYHLTLNQA